VHDGCGFTALRSISQKVNRDNEAMQMSLEWKDLTFAIGEKTILNQITGHIEPGKLTCVLGPSGSGKSTLMNVLAGRQNTSAGNMSSSGVITSSGLVVNPVDFRGNVAYVMQDDSLMGTETPRECLAFSASMRLPRAMPFLRKISLSPTLSKLCTWKNARTLLWEMR
jgi:ABC-type multidrug transport system ATPase subunit